MTSLSPRALPVRLRIALAYTLLLIITIVAVSAFLLTALESNLQRQVDETLSLRASRIDREVNASGEKSLKAALATRVLSDLAPVEEFSAPGVYIQILDSQGVVLSSSPNLAGGHLPATSEMIDSGLAGREEYATVPVGRERVRVLVRPLLAGQRVVGVALIGESLHLLDVTLQNMQRLLALAAAGSAALSLLGGWWLTAHTLRPVAEVTRVAKAIASTGRFDQRIKMPLAQDELGDLTATFNEMIGRLEKTFRRQREFLADASHELRGPLMVIRGNLDLLKLRLSSKERQESAREAIEEVDRMSRLVSDLLFLAEVEAQEEVEHQPLGLDEVVAEVYKRAMELDDGSHQIAVTHDDAVTVLGDRDRLVQMVWNLVKNALRYTPAGGRVTVSLHNHGPVAELIVADNGIGIPPEHLPRIFERFYRVDRARSHTEASTGLGLAIVKQIVEAHGGQVRVRSEPGEGSTFTVALPTLQT